MRLWSLHPRYLDRMGLCALWREGLLAQKVLQGETRGYVSHPQLWRFRQVDDSVAAIGAYLREVLGEASRRGYHFDGSKIAGKGKAAKLPVTTGQLAYEWRHLQAKLRKRCPPAYERNQRVGIPEAHPAFTVVEGGVEDWERT